MVNRQYNYVTLDVFTSTRFQGNPLAVVPDADGFSDNEMQRVAAEFNLSETVFLLPPSNGTAAARARIFTPRRELPFAGHPTIGAAAVLAARKRVGPSFVIEESVGPIDIECDADLSGTQLFWLSTPPVAFFETLDPEFCTRLLGVDRRDVRDGVPPTFISAGSPLLCICLTSTEAVDRAQLQHAYLPRALGSVNSVATFVFARKEPRSDENFDVYSRMFAPQTGITEDPATGGATGPLAAYMMRYGLLPRDVPARFVSEQGVKMGRRSVLHVRTSPNDASIKVGGSTVSVASGVLALAS
ncbi:MAG: PhzF family phenazine biosynthesis protein [Candidatus Eremiobacteraeota bacterium]|nr:PhzF family phenazine biosynthesis protein [Candidatus Eremiobacteraeota bacterium]